MAANKIPGLVKCIEDYQPSPPDLEQLALNEDNNINERIGGKSSAKDHVVVNLKFPRDDHSKLKHEVQSSAQKVHCNVQCSPEMVQGKEGQEDRRPYEFSKEVNVVCNNNKSQDLGDSEIPLDLTPPIDNSETVTINGQGHPQGK
ncbi:hypothetical protein V6N11_053022 [Hibiscus sabdariffa]|uniref:Uncharacterized protein n=1 Tax=Hibiscus sabdariffa TaxID=183260 RepID=A0ABR2UBV7_9ROSI